MARRIQLIRTRSNRNETKRRFQMATQHPPRHGGRSDFLPQSFRTPMSKWNQKHQPRRIAQRALKSPRRIQNLSSIQFGFSPISRRVGHVFIRASGVLSEDLLFAAFHYHDIQLSKSRKSSSCSSYCQCLTPLSGIRATAVPGCSSIRCSSLLSSMFVNLCNWPP